MLRVYFVYSSFSYLFLPLIFSYALFRLQRFTFVKSDAAIPLLGYSFFSCLARRILSYYFLVLFPDRRHSCFFSASGWVLVAIPLLSSIPNFSINFTHVAVSVVPTILRHKVYRLRIHTSFNGRFCTHSRASTVSANNTAI